MIFQLPDGTRIAASTISKLAHNVCQPAKDVHIIPTIATISTAKFATAGYITAFDDEEMNIYVEQNTTLKVSQAAILQGWLDKEANLWQIPLVPIVLNNNTDTVLVNNPQQSSYLIAHLSLRLSTTTMSLKRNQN